MTNQYQSVEADIVIVGSGVAGALPAYVLAKNGFKVLVLEAGHRITRSETVQRFRQTHEAHHGGSYPQYPGARYPTTEMDNDYIIESGPDRIKPIYLKVVGGTTWHWGAMVPRFMPEEFMLKSRHGVGVDWPIGYDDLEPYYAQAEVELGVSGDDSDNLGSWRSTKYPQPKNMPSWMEQQVYERLKAANIKLDVRPNARNVIAYDGRPPCVGHNNCTPICPTGAQYAAINHVHKAEQYGAKVIDRCTAVTIVTNNSSRVTEVKCKRPDGSALNARGKVFILAANAVETPRLLLMSRSSDMPEGVANSSGYVGQYLMNHHNIGADYLLHERVYSGRGPLGSMMINQYRETTNKSHEAAMLFLTSNKVYPQGILDRLLNRREIYGQTLNAMIRDHFARQCSMICLIEELPDKDNRIELHPSLQDDFGNPRPLMIYSMSDYARRGLDKAKSRLDMFGKYLHSEKVEYHEEAYRASSHIAGTTRMGKNPMVSVVDTDCRCHDHENLFISSSSVFPTIGTANPTLTIAALALRIADTIKEI